MEAILAVNVYVTLKRAFGGMGEKGSGDEHGVAGRVGVISPYTQQVKVLREKFEVRGREGGRQRRHGRTATCIQSVCSVKGGVRETLARVSCEAKAKPAIQRSLYRRPFPPST